MQQALLNLAMNAVDASPADGEVKLSAVGRRLTLRIDVENSGVAIPDDAGPDVRALLYDETLRNGIGAGHRPQPGSRARWRPRAGVESGRCGPLFVDPAGGRRKPTALEEP